MVGPSADLRPLNITVRRRSAKVHRGHAAGRPAGTNSSPSKHWRLRGCSGYATRKMHSSAIVFMRVPAERSQPMGATVQHDDQRERLPLIGVRHIQFVSTGSGVVAVGLGNELSACRDNETPFQDAHVG